MSLKTLLTLLLLSIAGATTYWSLDNKDDVNAAAEVGALLVPGLMAELNQVDRIQLQTAAEQTMVTLVRSEQGWGVLEKDHYPADLSKIRATMLALAEAYIVEEKTSNPELYARLGVQAISAAEASGVQITVSTPEQSHALIVGKPGPQMNRSRYVRLQSDATTWLIDRKIDVQYDNAYWLRKDLFSVEASELTAVSVKVPNEPAMRLLRKAAEHDHSGHTDHDSMAMNNESESGFILANPSQPDAQVIDAELQQMVNALSSFQLLDVEPLTAAASLQATMQAEFHLLRDIKLTLSGYESEKDKYVQIDASVSADADAAAKAWVSDLNTRLQGWLFRIPAVSYDAINKREADVLAITLDQLN
jgi:hypothetical protein|tara:strand:- start:10023 stop:11108 length:1086 start_codon:yes stop_codon:yes gene_type:complete